jgi:hypothetical protein
MYHFEGITTAAIGQKEYRHNIARNSLIFRARYHELFKTFTEELPAAEYRWRQRDELGLTTHLDLRYSEALAEPPASGLGARDATPVQGGFAVSPGRAAVLATPERTADSRRDAGEAEGSASASSD